LSCKELGFSSRVFFSSYGFVDKALNKLNHIETHVHPLPQKEEPKRRRKTNGNEVLGPLNFPDFLAQWDI
jgi:hypothetical protein